MIDIIVCKIFLTRGTFQLYSLILNAHLASFKFSKYRARNSGLPIAKSRPYFRNGRAKLPSEKNMAGEILQIYLISFAFDHCWRYLMYILKIQYNRKSDSQVSET